MIAVPPYLATDRDTDAEIVVLDEGAREMIIGYRAKAGGRPARVVLETDRGVIASIDIEAAIEKARSK